ncbi:MAG: asparagine synthase (glutamine-hydrolyzing) [Lachnospiraceae bacterium]|nr:asparagine synthase (glutamine-hydrolyzing) [Lachnospiraceae bacterium]
MCSISGFFNPSASFTGQRDYFLHILDEMKQTLAHRGPDENDRILTKHCGLAHTRLSIIDLQNGHQPMTKTVDGFSYHMVYNGEIYNLDTLKKRLLGLGYDFETTSDTEVLLLSFLAFGADFVKDVDGIFAFAVYDERHKTLSLFRDAFGVKPLFYTIYEGTLIFSSEPKGCFCFPGVTAALDKNGLNEILSLGPARTPGSGIFKDFHELLPGNYMIANQYGRSTTSYFHLESHPHFDSYEETVEKTSFLVQDAVRRQMVSDVPVCTFLSGGIDSSVVSAICAAQLKKENKVLTTYSFDFTENDKYFKANKFQPSQDRPYVEKMVEFLQSEHHFLECSNTRQADLLTSSVDAHDFPCMVDIDSSLLYFCGEVSKTHKVVLTGECADEVFGGYPWFHREDMLSSGTFPWTPSLEPRKALLSAELTSALDMDDYVKNTYDKAVSEINILPGENETETNRRRIGYLNIRFFMQTLLNRMDRTSMHSGLEARVPFADKALVDYVFNIPWEMKAKDGLVKNMLRQATKGLLPDEILFRRKSPYPKSYNPYYETLLASRLREVLADSESPLLPLLNMPALNQFLDNPKDYGAPWYGQLMAGPQMIAYLLQIDYFLKKYKVSIHL